MKGIVWIRLLKKPNISPMYFNIPDNLHVTLMYGVEEREVPQNLIGKEIEISILAEAWDHQNQALIVDSASIPECLNPIPHVSISWDRGSRAVASNNMLAGKHHEPLS